MNSFHQNNTGRYYVAVYHGHDHSSDNININKLLKTRCSSHEDCKLYLQTMKRTIRLYI